jgi:hypothetical protein
MKEKKITFYVIKEVAESIEEMAMAQNRSVSSLIASLIIPQLPIFEIEKQKQIDRLNKAIGREA